MPSSCGESGRPSSGKMRASRSRGAARSSGMPATLTTAVRTCRSGASTTARSSTRWRRRIRRSRRGCATRAHPRARAVRPSSRVPVDPTESLRFGTVLSVLTPEFGRLHTFPRTAGQKVDTKGCRRDYVGPISDVRFSFDRTRFLVHAQQSCAQSPTAPEADRRLIRTRSRAFAE